jgi:hypothetical protein
MYIFNTMIPSSAYYIFPPTPSRSPARPGSDCRMCICGTRRGVRKFLISSIRKRTILSGVLRIGALTYVTQCNREIETRKVKSRLHMPKLEGSYVEYRIGCAVERVRTVRSAALTEYGMREKKKENFSFVGCCHRTSPATELLFAFLAWRDIGIVSQMTIAYPLAGGNY